MTNTSGQSSICPLTVSLSPLILSSTLTRKLRPGLFVNRHMEGEIRPKRSSLELISGKPPLERGHSFDSSTSEPAKVSKLQNSVLSGSVTARPRLDSLIVGTPLATPPNERLYYTLAIRVQDIIVPHREEEREDHVHFQVSFSMDGMTSMIKPVRIPPGSPAGAHEHINVTGDPILFQAIGSPSGTLLVVRLLSSNRQKNSEMTEVGMAIVDLSLLSVGHPMDVSCLMGNSCDPEDTETLPTVNVNIRLYSRRKSFTFSFLKADPVFRRSGYTVRMEGLTSFPRPYKKTGMPAG